MSATEIVIASAKRTAVGSFNGAFANTPAHDLGAAAITAALAAAKVERGRSRRSHPRADSRGRPGPEPRPSGGDEGRHSAGKDRVRHQPAVRQRPARGGARPAADRQRRRRNHRRRRHGIDVAGPARRASAQRREDGRPEVRRLDAEGRPHRRLPRLSHGQHGRERRRQVAAQPRGAGPLRDRLAEQGRGGAEGAASSRTRSSPFTVPSPQGRRHRRPRTSSSARARPTKRSPSCARRSPRTARSPPATPRASTTAPRRWC